LEQQLHRLGMHTSLLDCDKLRTGSGWSPKPGDSGQAENIRRIGEVAQLMTDAGLVVLACINASTASEREAVRAQLPAGVFIEVFVGTAIESASSRSTNNLSPQGLRPELRIVSSLGDHSASHQPPEISIDGADETPDLRDGRDSQVISGVIARITQMTEIAKGERR